MGTGLLEVKQNAFEGLGLRYALAGSRALKRLFSSRSDAARYHSRCAVVFGNFAKRI